MRDFERIERQIRQLIDRKRMGTAFEHVVAHYLRRDPTVGLVDVWLWDDWDERRKLGLKADQGIDIVAIDGEGKRVAIQVKFHSDPDRDVTQEKVATLFSFRPDLFDRWVIVSNAIGHSRNAERATAGRGDVTWVHRDALVDSGVDWTGALEAVSGKAEPQIERRTPHEPEQVEAINDTLAALQEHERVQLIMACGTGKTLTTRWITEAREDRLVLVLVPTLLLLKQFRAAWREQAAYDFIDIGVCSDADTMESSRDVWRVHPDELGVRVTTDPADIAAFLKGDGRRVIFGTYASSARIAEAQSDPSVPAFDLVVADEAHRVAGITSRGNKSERETKVVLNGERIRARKRLFATATPRVYGPANRAMMENLEEAEFASMDDVEHFGVEAHRLWFKRAVELGRLVDYRLSVVVVTDDEVRRLVQDRAYVDVQGRTFDAETLATLIAVRRAVDELGVKRVITFHHTIKRAEDFARELERLELDALPVAAQHVSGSMSMADRQRVLASLEEPELPTVVTNARCLTEGIDVPSLGAVAFVDPRSAPVDIVQAVGRVMRIAKGKELGHVIVPVFLTQKQLADPEAAIESSAFESVLGVLRALRAHDPELVTDATRIATSLGRRDAHVGGYINDHLQVLGAEVDVTRFAEALEQRFVDVSADRFEVGLERLRSFAKRHGHTHVLPDHRENGYPLGHWVATQRRWARTKRLSVERRQALEGVPRWSWEPLEESWEAAVGVLLRFAVREKHARVPMDHLEDGFPLGSWVGSRRAEHRRGTLSARRTRQLEEVPGWTWAPIDEDWEQALSLLRRYSEREGHARVPVEHVEDGYRLGYWVHGRRTRYRRGSLRPDQIRALESISGWRWDPREDDWQRGMRLLERFAEREGHTRVPRGHLEDGFTLGNWVVVQRHRTEPGSERARRLEALPSWSWDPRGDEWQKGMKHLRRYAEREGHARVPSKHVEDGFQLGRWVSKRRAARSRGSLTLTRVEELESVEGWSWEGRHDDRWQEAHDALVRFAEREGHTHVPQDHVEGVIGLGVWVTDQRVKFRRGGLAAHRADVLERLPGWTWDTRHAAWRRGMEALRRYIDRTGHARPPAKHVEAGYPLGRWVAARRKEYRRNALSSDRIAELEALPGWAWRLR